MLLKLKYNNRDNIKHNINGKNLHYKNKLCIKINKKDQENKSRSKEVCEMVVEQEIVELNLLFFI